MNVVQNGRSVVRKVQIPELNLTVQFPAGKRCNSRRINDFTALLHKLVNASERCSAPLENVDHPPQRDNWPSELNHVGVEGHKPADIERAVELQRGGGAQIRKQANRGQTGDYLASSHP